MDENQLGPAVEARYRELGLTQETLAWLAGVSTTTVRNVLHGRVTSARTWPKLESALAWPRGSRGDIEEGEPLEELVPVAVLKPLYAAILQISLRNSELAEATLGLWQEIFRGVRDNEDEDEILEHFHDLLETVMPVLPLEESWPIKEFARDFGYREAPHHSFNETLPIPGMTEEASNQEDDSLVSRFTSQIAESKMSKADNLELAKQELFQSALRALEATENASSWDREGIAFFRQLPLRVQEKLVTSEAVDADFIVLPDIDDMSIVTIVTRKKERSGPLTARERQAVLRALKTWHMTLTMSATVYQSFLDGNMEIGAPSDIEDRLQETLAELFRTE